MATTLSASKLAVRRPGACARLQAARRSTMPLNHRGAGARAPTPHRVAADLSLSAAELEGYESEMGDGEAGASWRSLGAEAPPALGAVAAAAANKAALEEACACIMGDLLRLEAVASRSGSLDSMDSMIVPATGLPLGKQAATPLA